MSFFEGFFSHFTAITKLSKYGLWLHVLLAGLIGLLIGVACYSLIFSFGDNLGTYIASQYPFEFAKSWIIAFSPWLARIVLSFIFLFIYKYIIIIVLSPILSVVSMKVEKALLGTSEGKFTFLSELMRSVRLNLRNLYKELIYTILLIIVGFIPIVGFISPVMLFLVQSYFIGFGAYDFFLERHMTVTESIQKAKQEILWLSGVGAGFVVTLFIPFVGFFIGPILSTIATTEGGISKIYSEKP